MYRIRKSSTKDSNASYYITVPKQMAATLPKDGLYTPEFTEEGILYKFVGIAGNTTEEGTVEAPAWAVGLDKKQHSHKAA